MNLRVALTVALLALGTSANASLITDTVNIDWNFPEAGIVAFGQAYTTVVAADNSDVVNLFGGSTQVDMNGSGFVLSDTNHFINPGSANFLGLHVFDMQWVDSPGEIVGLNIQATGLDANDIVGTIGPSGDEVFINLVDAEGTGLPDWQIEVTFEVSHSDVPAPATLGLLGLGLLGLGIARRKRV